MNAFDLGFKTVSTVTTGATAVKHGAQAAKQTARQSARAAKQTVTSFFSGMSQALRYHTGKCKLLPSKVGGPTQ
jgi:hypothetical protein